jgi:ABC-type transport system involved in cytochrome c biogenesis permease subunit
MITHVVAALALGLYLVAGLILLSRLWWERSVALTRLSVVAWVCAMAAHTVLMGVVLGDARYGALSNGADHLLWVSWGVAIACGVLWRRLQHPLIGSFVVSGIVLFMASSSYLLHQDAQLGFAGAVQDGAARSAGVLPILHAVPALVAVVSLVLAFVISVVFLIVERRLKRRNVVALAASAAGPNLQRLDLLNRQLAQIGFGAVSLVLLTGGVWAVSQQRRLVLGDSSVLSGLATWILLALLLHVRLVLRWSPRHVSRLTVAVTGVFFISVVVVMIWSGRLTHVTLSL